MASLSSLLRGLKVSLPPRYLNINRRPCRWTELRQDGPATPWSLSRCEGSGRPGEQFKRTNPPNKWQSHTRPDPRAEYPMFDFSSDPLTHHAEHTGSGLVADSYMSADWDPTVNPMDLVHTFTLPYNVECGEFANFNLVTDNGDNGTSNARMAGQWEQPLIARDLGSGFSASDTPVLPRRVTRTALWV